MNLPNGLFIIRWLVRDTFRQALASRTFWLMLVVSAVCILFCLSVRIEGGDTLRPAGAIELSKEGEPVTGPVHMGSMSLGFGAIRFDLPRDVSGEPRAAAVHFLQAVLALWVAGTVGILAAVIWTAGFMPAFLDPAAAPVLLAKPAPRWLLVVGKFLGVLIFVAFQVTVFFGGTWGALGLRTGVWGVPYLFCIPLLLVHFAIIYSFSILLAVSTRSTVTCIFGSVLFWFVCYAMNYGRHTLWSSERGKHGRATAVGFQPRGELLASGYQDGAVVIWDLATGDPLRSYKDGVQAIRRLNFAPDGSLLGSVSDDGTIKVRDPVTGQEQESFARSNREGGQVVFRPGDGMSLIWTNEEAMPRKHGVEVRIREFKSGRDVLTPRGHTGRVVDLAFRSDGRILATAGADKNLIVWDAKDGQALAVLRGHKDVLLSVAFQPGSPMLASASADHSIRIWDLTTQKTVFELSGHNEAVISLAYSPDGKWLASAGADETVIVWDATTGQKVYVLSEGGSQVAFSPNSRHVAGSSAKGPVKIWDVSTGQLWQSLPGTFPRTGIDHLVEAGYWILPKPGDLNILLDQTLSAKDHFEVLPESFRRMEDQGALQVELSMVTSLLFTCVLLAIAARELSLAEY